MLLCLAACACGADRAMECVAACPSEDGSEVSSTVMKPASLELLSEHDITPPGQAVNRPDVTRVHDDLWLAYGLAGQGFRLQRWDESMAARGAALDLASPMEMTTDIRVAVSGEPFWYAAETVTALDDCTSHFLNVAVYTAVEPPRLDLGAWHIATGCPTSPSFIQKPGVLPKEPEAVDDPTPFTHRGHRYVLTRAWTLAKPLHHLRQLDDALAVSSETLLDTSTLIPERNLGPNVLMHIDGIPYLVGAFFSGPPIPPNTAELYALSLADDLHDFAGTVVKLVVDDASYVSRVTRARHVNGTLIINFVDKQPEATREFLAMFDVRAGFLFLSQTEVQNREVVDNHSSFEVVGDRVVLVQQQPGEKLSMKVFRMLE